MQHSSICSAPHDRIQPSSIYGELAELQRVEDWRGQVFGELHRWHRMSDSDFELDTLHAHFLPVRILGHCRIGKLQARCRDPNTAPDCRAVIGKTRHFM